MKNNFNLAEILKSVDAIVGDNKRKTPDEIIDILVNPITEKIIIDAEESLKKKYLENNIDKIDQSPLVLNSIPSSNLNLLEPLILKEEFSEPLILKKKSS
jgi:hypothetical protein